MQITRRRLGEGYKNAGLALTFASPIPSNLFMATLRLLLLLLLPLGGAHLANAQSAPSATSSPIPDGQPLKHDSSPPSPALGWAVAGIVGVGLGYGIARFTDDRDGSLAFLSAENTRLREKMKELRQRMENQKWGIKPGPGPQPATGGKNRPAPADEDA